MDLAKLIRHYIINRRPHMKNELAWFLNQTSLEDAIRLAALAVGEDGKRLKHQRRITRENLEKARVILASHAIDLQQCSAFDELLDTVETNLHGILGLGKLYDYDTSLRIGVKLGLAPEKIYLHAGTRLGARALGLDWKARCVEVTAMPGELKKLEPREIEDFLCIYKNKLESIEKKQ